jgi:hypothetical protein
MFGVRPERSGEGSTLRYLKWATMLVEELRVCRYCCRQPGGPDGPGRCAAELSKYDRGAAGSLNTRVSGPRGSAGQSCGCARGVAVRKSGEQDNSTVLFQDIGRTKGIELRFALLSAPATTKSFLDHKDRSSDMFVFAATITSVEKVSMPPDGNDNDQDYFLAHGILHEAQSIGFRDQPPKK